MKLTDKQIKQIEELTNYKNVVADDDNELYTFGLVHNLSQYILRIVGDVIVVNHIDNNDNMRQAALPIEWLKPLADILEAE